ncbi:MAG: aminomethyl-transferring glycine dehydrogenase subunit GcvPA [Treponema sp.]|jgi:glycine dehydrogenase subunit 1|nr:aminomethyl-transferring glycine dehydrogenase subunit GcvPA [Treponema sp.]
MGSYVPNTDDDRREMLNILEKSSIEELFAVIPKQVRVKDLNIPSALSEIELARKIKTIAQENKVFPVIFRGAGAYRHYIPAAVKRISSNETFLTAYTPYQAEISQGILQAIFEYQTMICELTGMDVSNASVYDGASAAAEAVNMCRDGARRNVYVSAASHPHVIETINTYCMGYDMQINTIPVAPDGKTDLEAMEKSLAADKNAASVYLQSPNFFGLIEDTAQAANIAHNAGALLVTGVNPISLGIFESPGALGADIAVGEGQSLGLPLAFGGPYLGFMACKKALMRKLPGRIVGETVDSQGERAFVLTLQAREQHIRREKAFSNICSNEAHCALTAAIYLSVMGQEGFIEASRQCHSKAVYASALINKIPGFSLVHDGEFFNEFVSSCPNTEKTLKILEQHDILGGYPLTKNRILWCVTEVNTKEEIDELASILRKINSSET